MARPREIITKSELARDLGLSKARVSQLCGEGMPVRGDGRVHRQQAIDWYRDRGLADQPTKRGPKPKAAMPSVTAVDTAAVAHAASLAAIQRIAAPAEVLRFARIAIRAGCSPLQAYIVANWFSMLPSLAMDEFTETELNSLQEPTNDQWKVMLGNDFDFQSANVAIDEAGEE